MSSFARASSINISGDHWLCGGAGLFDNSMCQYASHLSIKRSAPPVIEALKIGKRNLLRKDKPGYKPGDSPRGRVWRLSVVSFTLKELRAELAEAWYIPLAQLTIETDQLLDPKLKLRLPEGVSIQWPVHT